MTYDPLRFCIFTTIAILAWVFSPPVAVTVMSGLGLAAYVSAHRRGLRESRCVLRSTKLVIGYLGIAFVLGAAFTVQSIMGLFR